MKTFKEGMLYFWNGITRGSLLFLLGFMVANACLQIFAEICKHVVLVIWDRI